MSTAPSPWFAGLDAFGQGRQRLDAHGLLVIAGGGRCRCNRIDLDLPTEAVLVLQAGDQVEAPSTALLLRFHLGHRGEAAGWPPLFRAGILPEQQVVALAGREWEPLLTALQAECSRPEGDAICQGLAAALIGRIQRGIRPDLRFHGCAMEETFADRLAILFRRHEARRLDVRAMARDLGMSERQLTAVCRARLGVPPARAFTAHRVARAADLLAATDWPIKAVADRLGFSNPFHFSRVFHRCHGCTPSAFRARALPAVGA